MLFRSLDVVPGLDKRRKEEQSMFSAADGGVFSGPKSGYSGTLHGQEAVIPLKNGAVPVTISPAALLGAMPQLEIDPDSMEKISQMTGREFGSEVKTAISSLADNIKTLVNPQNSNDEAMLEVMQDIARQQRELVNINNRIAVAAANS